MKLTLTQVQQFLDDLHTGPSSVIEALSGGQWSQAFGFKRTDKDYVVRFGERKDDYLKDQFAVRFASDNLPIPKVLEVGEAFGGYYAISERAFGTMIDDLDKDGMKRVIPSLFATMDAIREVDVSWVTGFGGWDVTGSCHHSSWREVLLAVANDRPDSKTHDWKTGLRGSPVGDEPFNEAYSCLTKLVHGLPEVKSLIHNDLLNFNVLVNDNKITAVIDWANALCGDFLYDLAQFTFWGPLHPPVMGVDWKAEAVAHYQAIGLEVPMFEERLRACMVYMGLDAQVYYGFKKDWTHLEPVAKRTLELAKGGI